MDEKEMFDSIEKIRDPQNVTIIEKDNTKLKWKTEKYTKHLIKEIVYISIKVIQ